MNTSTLTGLPAPQHVLLVDEQPLILAALEAMVHGLVPGCAIHTATSAEAARAVLAGAGEIDLTVLDLHLSDADGYALLREWPTPVVVTSANDTTAEVMRAIDLGAMGFLPKRLSTQALAAALEVVMSGGIYVPPMRQPGTARPATAAPPTPLAQQTGALPLVALGLTPRQGDVLAMLLQARPNKDIARRLELSVETVKDHVAAVLRALGVANRTQAVLAVSERLQQPALLHQHAHRPQ